jgi:transposase
MKAKRKRYDSEFKARVALEALKAERTIQEIAKEYEVHPVQVSEWKKRMAQGASEVFEGGGKKAQESDFYRERDNLHRKIGQLSVELDWLRKKSKQLGL